jgi:hypothetical protein
MSSPGVPQFAKHPLTGASIRIMTTEAAVWRDQKTLVWLDEAACAAKVSWNRWEVGVTSLDDYKAAESAGIRVDVLACLGDAADATDHWKSWIIAGGWKGVALFAVPKTLVEAIGYEQLMALKINNMVCLDEMHELYPFVGAGAASPWDGTEADAKILLALALRMGRTFPVEGVPAEGRQLRGLRVETTLRTPPPLWLVQQYYKPDKARRRKEIDACLEANLANPMIDRVVLLNETACAPSKAATAGKLHEEVIGQRLTYRRVFEWIAAQKEDAIVVFANSDIFLDTASTRVLWSADLEKKFLALLRWDVDGTDEKALAAAKLFGPRADSQDTWVVSAASVRAAFVPAAAATAGADPFAGLDFPFGQGGCDNAITLELLRRKFIVANPALTLRTYHFHTSAVRTYDPRNIVSKAAYLYVQPTGFHDMRADQGQVPREATQVTFKRRSFPRPVAGPASAAQLRTFCTMVARATGGGVVLDVDGSNLWSPEATGLFRARDVFQSPQGLTFSYDSIHVGRTKACQAAWGASELSSMAVAVPVDVAAVAPLPDVVAKDPGRYVLEYLSKVFVLRGLGSAAAVADPQPPVEFMCSSQPACIEAVKLFNWPTRQVPVISRDETHQTWCRDAWVWPYSDEPSGFPSQEEVAALRGALGGARWKVKPDAAVGLTDKRIVVVVDGTVITEAFAESVQDIYDIDVIWEGRTTVPHAVETLRGAAGIVLAATSSFSAWTWVLPLGAYVWEVQSEMKPSAAGLHLAAAGDLHHRLLITPKGFIGDAERATVGEKLRADMRLMFAGAAEGAEAAATDIPTLIMPTGHTGRFEHAGDSFREMAYLWNKKGYVKLVQSGTAKQVWLGGIGETLLYDRPNMDWLRAAPAEERVYKQALFGNPAPPAEADGKALPWTFWPRRPNLVESLVAVGLPTTGYAARPDGLVFYGRSENAVQLGHRKSADWAAACAEGGKFVHVEGTGAYPFTHEEYLVNLSKARFGLCLAGYGRKCHREVECMAMGCVPVVAQEVDMMNYAEPPQVGVHYFRVSGPAEAAALVKSITPLRWAAMSAACRDWWARNASVEGSWRLTASLASSS